MPFGVIETMKPHRSSLALVVCFLVFAGCHHPPGPMPGAATEAECQRLYSAWKRECEPVGFSSNSGTYIALPSYRRMVAIGKPALPFLEHKMQEDWMLAYAAAEIWGWDRRSLGGPSGQEFRDGVLKKLRESR